MNLAWWHNYKHTCFQVYSVFADDIFAPLWHHMYPGHIFYKKPSSFGGVLAQLLCLHQAYPRVRVLLDAVLALDTLRDDIATMAKDLKFLLDIAVPVVHLSRTHFPHTLIGCCLWQVLDYGVSLRLNDGVTAMQHLVRLLQVLMATKRPQQHNYGKSIVMQLLLLLSQAKANVPVWQLFKNNMAAFNEEVGELAFSVLARAVLGDAQKSNFNHLNEMYTLIHTYRAVDDDVRQDIDKTGPKCNWRHVVDCDGEKVDATKSWLVAFIRKLRYNQLSVYNGSKKGYASAVGAAAAQTRRATRHPMWEDASIRANLALAIATARKTYMDQAWGHCISSVWPELKHRVAMDRSRSEVACSGADEEDAVMAEEPDPPPAADPEEEEKEEEEIPELEDPDEFEEYDVEPPVSARRRPTMDVDARGEDVSWRDWGNVDMRFATDAPRSSRRAAARRVTNYPDQVEH